jgi:hypothetical protein
MVKWLNGYSSKSYIINHFDNLFYGFNCCSVVFLVTEGRRGIGES